MRFAMPSEPTTLVEMLAHRARDDGDSAAFLFAGRAHTYREVWEASGRFAAGLAARGVAAGDRVVLVLPNGPEFFAALYGSQRAGAIPVPLFPGSGPARVASLATACGAALTVLPDDLAGLLSSPGPPPASPVGPGDVALLQYTSGSTGSPKGVVLRHESLLTNVRQMIAGMEITPSETFVSWLPVCHDMGLILMTLVPFYLGARLVLLPTTLTDVRVWLGAIAEHRGTFTAAPDFAYRLCLRAVRDPARHDLSSLRVALNAAEPVRAETLRRFHEVFGLERVMVPGYGLAEATVGVSMQPPGTDPVVSERGLVAIGRPFPDVAVEIVGDDGEPVPAGDVGEVVVASPAVAAGYYGDPEATAALFLRPGAIRTGDLGYRDAAGEVFLVGRRKNVILQAGRNLAPQEIEEAVEGLPFVRRAAAVGIDRGRAEGEQAYVFAELRRAAPPPDDALREMARRAVEAVHERLGVRPGRVLLLRPRAIPLTANGKLRHGALKEAYLAGRLRAAGSVLFPA